MNYFLAVLFPSVVFFKWGRIQDGIGCLVLQLLLLGWIPATIWAVTEIKIDENAKRFKKMRDELR